MSEIKLVQGQTYDVSELVARFERWSAEDAGYDSGASVRDYFDASGRYLGPDVDGVEPLFRA